MHILPGAFQKTGMMILFGIIVPACARALPRIETVEFGPWNKAYRLFNADVEVVIIPETGRIVRYGKIGGPNALREFTPTKPTSQWFNYGGDKLWLWPQSEWVARTGKDWPPPAQMDGAHHQIIIMDHNRIRLISPEIPAFGGRFIREITLASTGTKVSLHNQFEQTSTTKSAKTASELQLWSVTQIPIPHYFSADLITTDTANGWSHLKGSIWIPQIDPMNTKALLYPQNEMKSKVGFRSQVIQAVYQDYTFTQTMSGVTKYALWPEANQAQIYLCTMRDELPDSMYAELEFLSPPQSDTTQLYIVWNLISHQTKREKQ